jgi:hypothetical protein
MLHTFEHRGIECRLTSALEDGFFVFRFVIGDVVTSGRIEARLVGLAVRKAQSAIDRQIKARGISAPSLRGRRRA